MPAFYYMQVVCGVWRCCLDFFNFSVFILSFKFEKFLQFGQLFEVGVSYSIQLLLKRLQYFLQLALIFLQIIDFVFISLFLLLVMVHELFLVFFHMCYLFTESFIGDHQGVMILDLHEGVLELLFHRFHLHLVRFVLLLNCL